MRYYDGELSVERQIPRLTGRRVAKNRPTSGYPDGHACRPPPYRDVARWYGANGSAFSSLHGLPMRCAVTRTKAALDAIRQLSNGPMAIRAHEPLDFQ